jgi:hypothetical protein
MPTNVIQLSEAGGWVAKVGRDMPEAAKRGLFAAAIRLVGTLKQLELPTDRGIARSGWKAEKLDDGAAVFNGVTQAVLMEGGVRAENVKIGRKMIDALAEWARRKGVGARFSKVQGGGRLIQHRTRPSEEALRGVAWAIAKSMQKRGIFSPQLGGLRPLERTTKSLGPEYVRQEVAREIKRSFGL